MSNIFELRQSKLTLDKAEFEMKKIDKQLVNFNPGFDLIRELELLWEWFEQSVKQYNYTIEEATDIYSYLLHVRRKEAQENVKYMLKNEL